jgi:hypothetical protein
VLLNLRSDFKKKAMKKDILFYMSLFSFICQSNFIKGQASAMDSQDLVLNVFIDCGFCDLAYFKEKFTIINYTREPSLADVQILVNTLSTGSGGSAYHLVFFGLKRYAHLNDTLIFYSSPDQTFEEIRVDFLEKIKLGLVPFLMKTSYANHLFININSSQEVKREVKDPWKSWMFELNGSASLFNQQLSKNYQISASVYVSKITPELKIESEHDFTYSESRLIFPINDSDFYSINTFYRSLNSSNLIVKSLGDHFGIGGIANFRNNPLYNLDFQMKLGPAVEYNIFKYTDATHKQCRFLYNLSNEQSHYTDTTIYNKVKENLYKHNLTIMFKYIKPWGDFNAVLNGSGYIDDFSCYSLGASSLTNIRITNGLTFNISVGLNMYRDQISQRKGTATPEEVLTYQKKMVSKYDYSINFGFTYRFGSKFNNTVNPRF